MHFCEFAHLAKQREKGERENKSNGGQSQPVGMTAALIADKGCPLLSFRLLKTDMTTTILLVARASRRKGKGKGWKAGIVKKKLRVSTLSLSIRISLSGCWSQNWKASPGVLSSAYWCHFRCVESRP